MIVNKRNKLEKFKFGPDPTENWTNLKTQILMKFTYSYCDETQKLKFLYKKINSLQKSEVKNNLTP